MWTNILLCGLTVIHHQLRSWHLCRHWWYPNGGNNHSLHSIFQLIMLYLGRHKNVSLCDHNMEVRFGSNGRRAQSSGWHCHKMWQRAVIRDLQLSSSKIFQRCVDQRHNSLDRNYFEKFAICDSNVLQPLTVDAWPNGRCIRFFISILTQHSGLSFHPPSFAHDANDCNSHPLVFTVLASECSDNHLRKMCCWIWLGSFLTSILNTLRY